LTGGKGEGNDSEGGQRRAVGNEDNEGGGGMS